MAPCLLLLPVLLLACQLPHSFAETGPPMLKTKRLSKNRVYIEMKVTVAKASPDCLERDVILVNGLFQPAIEVNVNDTVMINVINRIPDNFPQVSSGISIHWHGLYMWKNASWYDGAAYVTQCPISPGNNFTYVFQVDEAPGSYFWHDHSTANKANGLQGPFIVVQPNPKIQSPFKVANTFTMFLSDWYYDEGNTMAMRLNRPVVQDNVTANTGYFMDVPSPQSLIINGKGSAGDCDVTGTGVLGANGRLVPVCQPAAFPFIKPMAATGKEIGGCSHQAFIVEASRSYRFRLINAASSTYMTVCFEGHRVSMETADAMPVDSNDYDCIDLNSGQRYDIILSTKSGSAYEGKSFWISVHSQYRSMAPSTYAVLRYTNATRSVWPTTPAPQPGMLPWTLQDYLDIRTSDGVLGYLDGGYKYFPYYSQFSSVGGSAYFGGVLFYDANRTVTLNITQPIITDTGMVKWALNDVAMPTNPPCAPLQKLLDQNPNWIAENTVNASSLAAVQAADAAAAARWSGMWAAKEKHTSVYVNGEAAPMIPAVGMQVVEVSKDEIVEFVINNMPPDSAGNPAPGTMAQHPMHMHGHKFWIMGMGVGVFNRTADDMYLNTYNPILRDTITIPVNSWALIRIKADNPGIWPFHCHNLWHHFMGQQVYIVEAQGQWAPMPKTLPKCSKKCIYNFAPFQKSYINKTYGPAESNPHELPSF